ncbi:hypothetical protein HYS42_00625, partial [Candidatus Saccharibacteria bacterium]|nr:hypothetical protein [Candidatus Saccharibacteria bacterium]
MSMFEPKTLVILGRQPAFGLAELESLYGAEHLQPLPGAALLDVPAEEINFQRLGGSLKIARLLSVLPGSNWRSAYDYLAANIPEHLDSLPKGTFTLGVSVYGLDVSVKKLGADLLSLKKIIRESGRSVRIVPNKELELNSAQVLRNRLTHRGAWELLLVRAGNQTYLAQTLFVQNIDAYAARDQARPKRDARVGMLPPKLAQIIINLTIGPVEQKVRSNARLDGAQGAAEQRNETYKEYDERAAEAGTQRSAKSTGGTAGSASRQAGASRIRLLDPFCGTGVILQEALLMGYHALGSDIDPRMVDYAKDNIRWLVEKYPQIQGQVAIEVADATTHSWPHFSVVASEVYLGRPLAALPLPDKLKEIIQDVNTITKKFLANLAPQLKAGQSVVIAVPAWKTKNVFVHLPVLDRLTDMGYNR